MDRSELTQIDRHYVGMARDALDTSMSLDMSDMHAVAKMLGRLEVVVAGLLYILDDGTVLAGDAEGGDES